MTKKTKLREAKLIETPGFRLRQSDHVYYNSTKTNAISQAGNYAYSFGWYKYMATKGDFRIFNTYSYSPTTVGHLYKARRLLSELGHGVTHFVRAPHGLQNLPRSMEILKAEITVLQDQIKSPRTRASTNARRADEILRIKRDIQILEALEAVHLDRVEGNLGRSKRAFKTLHALANSGS